jgi:60 kDa SS-A/Ro ribonucleoprotein
MGPQALRMNLNTLLRHGVFEYDPTLVAEVAGRLSDPEEVRRSRQFPYQYLAAYLNADGQLPAPVREALQLGAEVACGNVPRLPGPVVVGLDVSGSMSSPVTGDRGAGATSKVRCVDAAAVFAAAILRVNPGSVVVPFDHHAYRPDWTSGTPVLTLASELARFGGGGTDCSLPLLEATTAPDLAGRAFAGCVLVSDNMSWIGEGRYGATATLTAWEQFRGNQRRMAPGADPKLVCIDVQPYGTVQAPDRDDVLNVGGFSDAVFDVVAAFLGDTPDHFVGRVEAVEL